MTRTDVLSERSQTRSTDDVVLLSRNSKDKPTVTRDERVFSWEWGRGVTPPGLKGSF